jgi:thioredoxin-related protein
MIHKITLTGLALMIFTVFSYGQESAPLPAEKIMTKAFSEAKASDKNVFLIFHASWCGWCKRLDKAMQSDELKTIFETNYTIVHLDVLERGEKIAALENPGGREYMKKLGGEKSGLPFYAFLKSDGEKISDSNVMPKETNIGYPGSEEEIEAFGKLLRSASNRLDDAQYTAVIEYLKKNAPKPAAH